MSFIIDNEPRSYDWGIPHGIEEIRGIKSAAFHTHTDPNTSNAEDRGGKPTLEAEWWLGTHPSWPSVVTIPNNALDGASLPEALAKTGHPEDIGYLLKILTIARPLSLQVHPDTAQAEGGFERENLAGIPLTSKSRNYKDPYAKPEMVYVLSDEFELCAGFRNPEDIIGDVQRIRGRAPRSSHQIWQGLLDKLRSREPIQDAMYWLLTEGHGQEIVAEISELLAQLPELVDAKRDGLLRRLVEFYLGDPGIAVSLLLRHEVLLKGQALFLEPRTPHFYICGVGMELMGPSDNVLRGGLTSKHVDVAELLKVMNFESSAPHHLFEYHDGALTVFQTPTAGLKLSLARVPAGEQLQIPFDNGEILYVFSGQVQITDAENAENADGHDSKSASIIVENAPHKILTMHAGEAALLLDAKQVILRADGKSGGLIALAGKENI